MNGSDFGTENFWSRMHTAKILRAAGQAIFLLINLFLAFFLYLSIQQDRSLHGTLPLPLTKFFRVSPSHGSADASNRIPSTKINPTLLVLVVAWPPLIIRGTFGLLQALVNGVNYAHPDAYDSFTGFTKVFVVMENVFSVLPEWTACCLLCSTMFTKEGRHGYRHSTGDRTRRFDSDTTAMSRLESKPKESA